MLVLITYDVDTTDAMGKRRLVKLAKQCVNLGQRVQNSVFEWWLDSRELEHVKELLLEIIDETKDSLRFYYLGNNYERRVEQIGSRHTYLPCDVLII